MVFVVNYILQCDYVFGRNLVLLASCCALIFIWYCIYWILEIIDLTWQLISPCLFYPFRLSQEDTEEERPGARALHGQHASRNARDGAQLYYTRTSKRGPQAAPQERGQDEHINVRPHLDRHHCHLLLQFLSCCMSEFAASSPIRLKLQPAAPPQVASNVLYIELVHAKRLQ